MHFRCRPKPPFVYEHTLTLPNTDSRLLSRACLSCRSSAARTPDRDVRGGVHSPTEVELITISERGDGSLTRGWPRGTTHMIPGSWKKKELPLSLSKRAARRGGYFFLGASGPSAYCRSFSAWLTGRPQPACPSLRVCRPRSLRQWNSLTNLGCVSVVVMFAVIVFATSSAIRMYNM